jgi:cytochrome c-type biogenesis protein CcmH/NrfG
VEFRALLADVHIHARQDSKTSSDDLQGLVTADRRSVTALRALGYVELKTGNFDQARKYFTQANGIRPDARTQYYLGLLDNSASMVTPNSAQPQLESVREHMASCLAQEPTFAAAFDLLGHVLAAQGRLRDSLDAFKQAANFGPRTDSYVLDLAEMELRLGLTAQGTSANLLYLLKTTDAAIAARAAQLMPPTGASF